MADAPVIRSDFYVYALFREDGEAPFYIGKGRGARMFVHERSAHRFTSHKDRIIQMMAANGIVSIPKVKLAEGLTDDDAKQIECDLIQLIGRWPLGPLTNLTRGGDGVADLSPESKAVKAEKNRKAWEDPERRKRRLAAMAAAWTPEMRTAHLDKIRKMRTFPLPKPKPPKIDRQSPEHKAKRSRAALAMWADPVKRSALQAKKRAFWNSLSADEIAKRTVGLKASQALAHRNSHLTNLRPEIREKRIAAQKAALSTPEAKARRSEASKRMWAAKRGHQ